jgi:hypothetical protein
MKSHLESGRRDEGIIQGPGAYIAIAFPGVRAPGLHEVGVTPDLPARWLDPTKAHFA